MPEISAAYTIVQVHIYCEAAARWAKILDGEFLIVGERNGADVSIGVDGMDREIGKRGWGIAWGHADMVWVVGGGGGGGGGFSRR